MTKEDPDTDLLINVQETVRRHSMLACVKKAIIGFSSGPDSVCLLDTLVKLFGGTLELCLVYVNHDLRPQKTLRTEENLTRFYASKYGIRYRIIRIKVRRAGSGLEAQARKERHNALVRHMHKARAQRIFLGHNRDDVVETFFINLLRGSGTKGMASIPAVRPPFARPLINLEKAEIIRYVRRRGLPYSVDKTNQEIKFRRNFLRLKIIPRLTRLNPKFHEMMAKSIDILRTDEEYLQELAEHAYDKVVSRRKKHLVLDLKRLMRYNKSIINRVIFAVIRNVNDSLAGFESKHVDSILSLICRTSGKTIHLPKRVYAQKIYDKIVVGKLPVNRSFSMSVRANGTLRPAANIELKMSIVDRYDPDSRGPQCEFFDLNELEPPFYVRSRKAGDFLLTKLGRKKLKKLFNEKKIPAFERDGMVMLCDQKRIIWVPGVGRAYIGFVKKGAKKILKAEFEYIDQ